MLQQRLLRDPSSPGKGLSNISTSLRNANSGRAEDILTNGLLADKIIPSATLG